MEYDILIVGARVAGAGLGLLLAQRGYRVLLVDRDEFPSDTMSTHFVGMLHTPLLARTGVLDELLAAGFQRLTRCRIHLDDCLFEGPLPPSTFALAPRRDVLDQLLVMHAMSHGADFRDRTRVEGLIWEGGQVVGAELAGRRSAAGREAIRARVVVGADGKTSSVARWVEAETYDVVPAMRPGYYGHYRGVAPLDEPAAEFFYGNDRIGYLFPMRQDEDCLVIEMQPEDFPLVRAEPQRYFEERFRALPGMANRLRGAHLEGKIIGIKGVENYFRKPYGLGWALTGDAAYLKDFSTGLGIGDALQQAFWMSDALDAIFQGAGWETTMLAFQQTRDEVLQPSYQTTLGYTAMRDPSPESLAWIKAALGSPGFARALLYSLPPLMPQIFPSATLSRVEALASAYVPQTDLATATSAPLTAP